MQKLIRKLLEKLKLIDDYDWDTYTIKYKKQQDILN